MQLMMRVEGDVVRFFDGECPLPIREFVDGPKGALWYIHNCRRRELISAEYELELTTRLIREWRDQNFWREFLERWIPYPVVLGEWARELGAIFADEAKDRAKRLLRGLSRLVSREERETT